MPSLINAPMWQTQTIFNQRVVEIFQNQTVINKFHDSWLEGLSNHVLTLETAVVVVGIISTVALGLGIYNFFKRRRDKMEMEKV